jgi:RNA polymerase sigma-70 factor (ECF subfamily)
MPFGSHTGLIRSIRYFEDVDLLLRTALRARDGDRVALEGFLRLVQADVWRTCRYMVDEQSADDLAQEVLVRVVSSLHRITAEHQVRGWVLGIARHVCLDEIRRRQRRRRVQNELLNLRPAAIHNESSDVELRELIEKLEPERRDVFVLTQIIGLSYEEAAEVCGCPIGTVRSRVARARMELQSLAVDSDERSEFIDGTFPPPRATG